MIPDEAIEAANRAALGRYLNKETVQLILEAAAPHLMARAWDEGRKHGAAYPYGKRGLATDDNPYRDSGTRERS